MNQVDRESEIPETNVSVKYITLPQNISQFEMDNLPNSLMKKPSSEVLIELSGETLANEEPLAKDNKENYTQEDFEDLPDVARASNPLIRALNFFQNGLLNFQDRFKHIIRIIIIVVLVLGYTAYFIWANVCNKKNEDDIRLIWMTILVLPMVTYSFVKYLLEKYNVSEKTNNIRRIFEKRRKIFYGIIIFLMASFVVFCLIYFVAMRRPANFISMIGMMTILLSGVVFSKRPSLIPWRLVLVGLWLQFTMGVLILQTSFGSTAFKFMGDRVQEFLEHTDAGSKFVFGDKYTDHIFVFKIMPVIVYFSMTVSILTHYGVLQVLVRKTGWLMQVTMGTTAGESMNTAANIFLGMTEAPLLIKPLVGRMTNSELHAIMTGGFATIAGTVFAAYITFGVPANHLLAASVMSAPAALAMSKLFYPETKVSKTTVAALKDLDLKSPYENCLDAAVAGALTSVKMVSGIVATLLAFIAGLHFLDSTLTWFGHRACLKSDLQCKTIMAYLLWPLAFLMGVDRRDCFKVAELIGVKTFITEFVAFTKLGHFIANRALLETFSVDNVTITPIGNDLFVTDGFRNATLIDGLMEPRSVTISTYALCGFANIGSIGIMISGLTAIAPHRKADLSRIVVRAMITGTLTTLLSACVAGLLSST